MALSYKARRRWSLVVLLIGLPVYIVTAVWVMSFFETRPHIVIEVLIYLGLGVVWVVQWRKIWYLNGLANQMSTLSITPCFVRVLT